MSDTRDESWFETAVRIYYEDTDFSGVVYHANYLKFAERGRSDYLRACGVHHNELSKATPPLVFVVTRMDIKFLAPARIDDLLSVMTRFTQVRGARLRAEQKIYLNDAAIWYADVDIACIDLTGKPRRLPQSVISALTRIET